MTMRWIEVPIAVVLVSTSGSANASVPVSEKQGPRLREVISAYHNQSIRDAVRVNDVLHGEDPQQDCCR